MIYKAYEIKPLHGKRIGKGQVIIYGGPNKEMEVVNDLTTAKKLIDKWARLRIKYKGYIIKIHPDTVNDDIKSMMLYREGNFVDKYQLPLHELINKIDKVLGE